MAREKEERKKAKKEKKTIARERKGNLAKGKKICTLKMHCNRKEIKRKSDGQREGDSTKGRKKDASLRCNPTHRGKKNDGQRGGDLIEGKVCAPRDALQ